MATDRLDLNVLGFVEGRYNCPETGRQVGFSIVFAVVGYRAKSPKVGRSLPVALRKRRVSGIAFPLASRCERE